MKRYSEKKLVLEGTQFYLKKCIVVLVLPLQAVISCLEHNHVLKQKCLIVKDMTLWISVKSKVTHILSQEELMNIFLSLEEVLKN